MTCSACRRALQPGIAYLQIDVVRTPRFSGGIPALQGKDRAAIETSRFGGVSFRAVAECRPVSCLGPCR